MSAIKLFEDKKVRSHWDEAEEQWCFSVVDVVEILTDSSDPKDYWYKMKKREKLSGIELSIICRQLKLEASDGKRYATDYWKDSGIKEKDEFALLTNIIHQEWTGLTVKKHKDLKGLKTQNLRDHMSEAELIFTALAELSTRQIAETNEAIGLTENAKVGKKGGAIAKDARLALEAKTGKKVVTGENFLPPGREKSKGLSDKKKVGSKK